MDPLRVYVHEKLLIRFCEKKHPRMEATGADGGGGVAAKLAEDLDTYVIGEHYQVPWDVPSWRARYASLLADERAAHAARAAGNANPLRNPPTATETAPQRRKRWMERYDPDDMGSLNAEVLRRHLNAAFGAGAGARTLAKLRASAASVLLAARGRLQARFSGKW